MYAATPSKQGAVQVRLALALVLLEHQPATLSLQDWLDSLRTRVKQRISTEAGQSDPRTTTEKAASLGTRTKPTSDSPREARTTSDKAQSRYETDAAALRGSPDAREGSSGARSKSREKEATPVAQSEDSIPQSTQLRLAASNLGPPVIAALEPLLVAPRSPFRPSQASDSPSTSTAESLAHRFLLALQASFSAVELAQADSTEIGVKFDALGTVGKWFVELTLEWRRKQPVREVDSDAGYGTRSKKKVTDRVETMPAKEEDAEADAALERLAKILTESLPHAALNPVALGNVAALLIQLVAATSETTRLSQSHILPALLRHLVLSLQAIVLPSPVEEEQVTNAVLTDSDAIERISAILSLAHLILDASPPKRDVTSPPQLKAALDELVRLLGTHGVDVQLAEVQLPFSAGGSAATSVERAVLRLVERIWELIDEPVDDEAG